MVAGGPSDVGRKPPATLIAVVGPGSLLHPVAASNSAAIIDPIDRPVRVVLVMACLLVEEVLEECRHLFAQRRVSRAEERVGRRVAAMRNP